MILGIIIFFILGTIIGSFLNVVILRYNSGRSPLAGRSGCPNCGHELGFYELVPVASFLFLGGKCLNCKSKISWQYPLIELFTGILFAGTYLKIAILGANLNSVIPNLIWNPGLKSDWILVFTRMTGPFLIIDLIALAILVVILVYDLRHKIIPDGLVYVFIIISLLKLFIYSLSFSSISLSWLDFLAGPLMFLPFFLLWSLSGGRWMGFGDAKLALGIGWFLGLLASISAIILAFWIGAIIGILLLAFQALGRLKLKGKRLTIRSEIPFAPFLILGVFLVYFFGFDVLHLSTLLIH